MVLIRIHLKKHQKLLRSFFLLQPFWIAFVCNSKQEKRIFFTLLTHVFADCLSLLLFFFMIPAEAWSNVFSNLEFCYLSDAFFWLEIIFVAFLRVLEGHGICIIFNTREISAIQENSWPFSILICTLSVFADIFKKTLFFFAHYVPFLF